jgi:predicted regulator of Ras-like GTPase activity (Roadblock/LC7/MglB family)
MADELVIDSKALIFATLADVYLSSGMVDEAISILKDGLGRNPNYTLGKIILGRAYYMKGDVDEALKTLEALYPDAKDSENANLYLARCHKRIGDLDKAAQFYEIVLKINPQNKDARQELDGIAAKPAAAVPKAEEPVTEAATQPPKAKEPVIETTTLPPTIKEAAIVAVPIMEEPVVIEKIPSVEKIDQTVKPPVEEPVIPIVDTIPHAMLRKEIEVEKEAVESAPQKVEPKAVEKEPPAAEKPVDAAAEPQPAPVPELTRAEKVAEIEKLLGAKEPEEAPVTKPPINQEKETEKKEEEKTEEVPILPEIGFETPATTAEAAVTTAGISPLDTLKEPMSHLLKLKAVKGAFICSRDGLLIQNSYEARADIEEIAALIAAICNEADDSFKFLKEGAMEKCIIEKGDESICVVTAGESLLCIATKPEAKPGLVFVYARKIIDQIREILG